MALTVTPITPGPHSTGVKREDIAGWDGPGWPSGAKVRQYSHMIEQAPDGAPLIVGCAAASAMQVYVADAARRYGREAHVHVPARSTEHPSTAWARAHGATIHTHRPGYMSVVRARARDHGRQLAAGGRAPVGWSPAHAFADTVCQATNAGGYGRIVVPTGSGLTAAAILAGLAQHGYTHIPVVAVCVSGLANEDVILATYHRHAGTTLAPPNPLVVVNTGSPYDKPHPIPGDNPVLDPYYSAKAVPYLQPGDLLWNTGRRP